MKGIWYKWLVYMHRIHHMRTNYYDNHYLMLSNTDMLAYWFGTLMLVVKQVPELCIWKILEGQVLQWDIWKLITRMLLIVCFTINRIYKLMWTRLNQIYIMNDKGFSTWDTTYHDFSWSTYVKPFSVGV